MADKLPAFHCPLPNRVVVDTRLTGTALRLLSLYAFHDRLSLTRGAGDGCTTANMKLCTRLGCDYTTLIKLRKDLEAWGYIQLEPRLGGKRLEVARVIPDHLAAPQSWPFDQSYIGSKALETWGVSARKAGEIAKNWHEKVGEAANNQAEKVGDEFSETRRNPPKTTSQHIFPEGSETYSPEGGETYSPEGAQRAFSAPRRDDYHDAEKSLSEQGKEVAQAGLGRTERVSIAALLPQRFHELPTEAQLSSFDRAFKELDRDPNAIEPDERKEFESWLYATADAFAGEPVGYQAHRLMEEFG